MLNYRKKLWGVVLFFLVVMLIAGCAAAPETKAPEESAVEEVADTFKIGIVQLVEHPALDAAREGFVDALADEGFVDGENIFIDYKNANGEQATCVTICEGFVADQVDLILAIATPAVQAAATVTKDIPIIFNSVTDPQEAGVVDSWDRPGTNVTGASDLNPVEEQLALLLDIVPEVKNVGVIYNSGEVNSVVQVGIAKKVASDMGITIVEAVAINSGEVSTAAESLMGKIDAFYIPTDNTVVSALRSVINVAEEYDLPVVAGDIESVENGALATLGITYYGLGRQSGSMAVQVLRGADPAEMPVQMATDVTYAVNLTAADAMGVEVPQEIIDLAREDGQLFE